MDSRKQAVSIRMGASDVRNIKKLAKRLGVRDSDIIRFAVKVMLAKLAPLHDPGVRGRDLVPVFVESGTDLFRHFDLDVVRLENIINDGVNGEGRVDHDDIQLIAMNGIQRSYVKLRFGGMNGRHGEGRSVEREADDEQQTDQTLRQYLYDKYLYGHNGLNSISELESKS